MSSEAEMEACCREITQMKRSSGSGSRFPLTDDGAATVIWERAGVDAWGQPGCFSATTTFALSWRAQAAVIYAAPHPSEFC